MGMVQQLVALVRTEHSPFHEHVLGALCRWGPWGCGLPVEEGSGAMGEASWMCSGVGAVAVSPGKESFLFCRLLTHKMSTLVSTKVSLLCTTLFLTPGGQQEVWNACPLRGS